MAEFLLELLSEEIPARMQVRAAQDLKRLFIDALSAAGMADPGEVTTLVTPRRLALLAGNLPPVLSDKLEEKRGPRVGAPDAAMQGFLKSAGVTLDQCEQRDTGKGVFWFVTVTIPGRTIDQILMDIVPRIIEEFPWPKSMRWAHNQLHWVRPLHNILALLDGKPLNVVINLGQDRLSGTDWTQGHRFLAKDRITIRNIPHYIEALHAAKVVLDPDRRRQTILTQAQQLATKIGGTLKSDEGLLEEVTGLAEWPVALLGRIDEAFMALPAEVLSTSMRAHQKYFSVQAPDGGLKAAFIAISNMEAADQGQTIVAGYERVLRARLSDAEFFWQQDQQIRLEERLHNLNSIIFYQKLGTMAQKVARVETLAAELAAQIPGADARLAGRAAQLSKADLLTGMVGEFPELQGIMGRYYALAQGENPAVADAIADHYAPLGPSDRCPAAPNSIAVALADKIDTLTGFFAVGERPTGSKDPFALRRTALGIIRLILENRLRLNLREIFMRAYWAFDAQQPEFASFLPSGHQPKALARDMMEFLADRLKVTLREQGIRHDFISAVFALGDEDDLTRLIKRVEALQEFLSSAVGTDLLTAYRRAANIVRIEDKKDGPHTGPVASEGLVDPLEIALHQSLLQTTRIVGQALASEDFTAAMSAIRTLRDPVDAFFSAVTVNCQEQDLRRNRLRLLSQIGETLSQVADFSKIEG